MGDEQQPPAADGLALVAGLRAWCLRSLRALAAARDEIDELNVYPVPDGDTGTNLFLTMRSATHDLAVRGSVTAPRDAVGALAHGALMGARGNSGVILSQMLRGTLLSLAGSADRGVVAAAALRPALLEGAAAAYAAVARPVEGTMLTVARAAAEAVPAAPESWTAAVSAAVEAAREALARTPEQLDVLRQAGVVDAGGRGLVVLLETLEQVVSQGVAAPDGREGDRETTSSGSGGPAMTVTLPECPVAGSSQKVPATVGPRAAGSTTYEVMYLLDASDDAAARLRRRLDGLGESVVVVGGDGLWNVHVHTPEAGVAVEAGIEAGRPHRIRLTSLETPQTDAGQGPRVVAVAVGPGVAALLEAAGAVVIASGPGARASTADLLDGVRRTRSREVVLLPNDRESLAVAEAAAAVARSEGLRVAVVPTIATVQALAAMAVHDPLRGFDDDVVAMTAAAGATHHGAVTVASREAMTMAGPCRAGDVLGAVGGDFVVVGGDLVTTACDVVDRMLAAGGELLTLLVGDDAPATLADRVVAHVRAVRREVDTVVHDGGQPRYPLLIGVE